MSEPALQDAGVSGGPVQESNDVLTGEVAVSPQTLVLDRKPLKAKASADAFRALSARLNGAFAPAVEPEPLPAEPTAPVSSEPIGQSIEPAPAEPEQYAELQPSDAAAIEVAVLADPQPVVDREQSQEIGASFQEDVQTFVDGEQQFETLPADDRPVEPDELNEQEKERLQAQIIAAVFDSETPAGISSHQVAMPTADEASAAAFADDEDDDFEVFFGLAGHQHSSENATDSTSFAEPVQQSVEAEVDDQPDLIAGAPELENVPQPDPAEGYADPVEEFEQAAEIEEESDVTVEDTLIADQITEAPAGDQDESAPAMLDSGGEQPLDSTPADAEDFHDAVALDAAAGEPDDVEFGLNDSQLVAESEFLHAPRAEPSPALETEQPQAGIEDASSEPSGDHLDVEAATSAPGDLNVEGEDSEPFTQPHSDIDPQSSPASEVEPQHEDSQLEIEDVASFEQDNSDSQHLDSMEVSAELQPEVQDTEVGTDEASCAPEDIEPEAVDGPHLEQCEPMPEASAEDPLLTAEPVSQVDDQQQDSIEPVVDLQQSEDQLADQPGDSASSVQGQETAEEPAIDHSAADVNELVEELVDQADDSLSDVMNSLARKFSAHVEITGKPASSEEVDSVLDDPVDSVKPIDFEKDFDETATDPRAGETARMLLDIMSKPSGAAQPQERALAADTLLRLVTKIPAVNLVALSERICIMEQPPALLVNKLIRHPDARVAGPLLETCNVISDQVLLPVISMGDTEKQRMIARRRSLTPALCDALLEHGDASVFLTIVRNPGAAVSHDAFITLSELAKSQPSLQAPLVTRGDTPAPTAFELFWFLPSELRRYVLSRYLTDSETLDKILKIALSVDGDVQDLGEGDAKFPERSQVENLADLINDGPANSAAALLSKLAGISQANALRIISDPDGEPLTVAMKAIGCSRAAFSAAMTRWQMSPSCMVRAERPVSELKNLFDSLSFNKARVLLTYWDWAALQTGPYARKAA